MAAPLSSSVCFRARTMSILESGTIPVGMK
jgi:hypothetical protein